MNARKVIKSRRSTSPFQFTDKEITDEEIKDLLEVARWAPSHKKTEPWRFVIVRGKGLHRLAEFVEKSYSDREGKPLSTVKLRRKKKKIIKSEAVILILMKRDKKKRLPEWEEIAAVACAVNNMWTYAAENNMGGYWSSPFYIDKMDEFIDLKDGERCLGLFYLGKINQQSQDNRKRKDVDAYSRWITE